MDLSITVNLGDTLQLDQLVALHSKARKDGFESTDEFLTDLVKRDLGKLMPPKVIRRTAIKPRKEIAK